MKAITTLLFVVVSMVAVHAQTNTENYVKTVRARQESDISIVDSPSSSITQQSVQYMDGLARPSQTIVRWATPDARDLITPYEYDGFGRQTKSYLPYRGSNANMLFQANPLLSQATFYSGGITGKEGDTYAYSETTLEPSPRNRPLEQASPGNDWRIGTNTVTMTYEFNTTLDKVKRWQFDGLETSAEDFYPANELYKNSVTDEDGNTSIEFTDKKGRTILKKSQVNASLWTETYYIYDERDRLRIVLPPEANNKVAERLQEVDGYDLISTSTDINSSTNVKYVYGIDASITLKAGTHLDGNVQTSHIMPLEILSPDWLAKWAFQYDYDGRDRMISKQVPGAEVVYMVYDQWDRLVLTQDGNQRPNNEWLFTKYDTLNRPVITGETVIISDILSVRNAASLTNTRAERYGGGPLEGYTNDAYPSVTAADLLTVTYYDDYGFVPNSDLINTVYTPVYTTKDNDFEIIPMEATSVTGLVTGTLTLAEGTDFITTITYYDDKYRPIQIVSENHLSGGKDIISNQYDFVGNVRKTQTEHFDGTSTTTIKRRYTYDHMDRLINTFHQINNEDEVLLAKNEYNQVGELITKDLHSEDGGVTSEQTLNYTYNIRGWLRGINDYDLPDPNDLFGMELHYNTSSINGSNSPQYNGNISAMTWSDPSGIGTGNYQAYDYTYDRLNRLESADHQINEDNENSFDVNNLQYDLNGNIINLRRRAEAIGSYMDNMTYSYDGNKLTRVTDSGDGNEGFVDGNTSGDDYFYDANGNMIADANKGITNITYNHLNLPTRVNMGSNDYIDYLYDAAGIKLQQKVYEGGSLIKTTDYVGEFIYEDGSLELIQHEEGRIIPLDAGHPEFSSGSKEHDYQYHLKDHLGNVRLTFNTTPENYEMNATMESSAESEIFNNYVATSDVVAANSGTHVFRNSNTVNSGLGLNTFLSVNKGDTVKASAYAYYNDAGGSYNLMTNLIEGALFTAFDPGKIAEGVTTTQSNFDQAFAGGTTLGGRSGSSNAPRAYINYIFFDTEMQYKSAAFKQITSASNGTSVQVIAQDFIANQEGYLMVYLSNETQGSEVVVSWDDLKVYHGKTNVVSTQDYYPFGLTFNESVRVASTEQRFKFNGGSECIDLLGMYMTPNRMYDQSIGRFWGIDALSDMFPSMSPMLFSYNNPVLFFDPTGLSGKKPCPKGVDCNGATILDEVVVTAKRPSSININYNALLFSSNPFDRVKARAKKNNNRDFMRQVVKNKSIHFSQGDYLEEISRTDNSGRIWQEIAAYGIGGSMAATYGAPMFIELAANAEIFSLSNPLSSKAIAGRMALETSTQVAGNLAVDGSAGLSNIDVADVIISGSGLNFIGSSMIGSTIDWRPGSGSFQTFFDGGKSAGDVGLDFGVGLFNGGSNMLGNSINSSVTNKVMIGVFNGAVSVPASIVKSEDE